MKRLYQRTYFENRLGINQKWDLKIIREKPDGLYVMYGFDSLLDAAWGQGYVYEPK